MTENGKRRPWWAAALLGGAAAGGSVVAALGLGPPARPHDAVAAPIVMASPVLPPGTISLDERLKNIEATLKVLGDDMAEVKRRLPSKP